MRLIAFPQWDKLTSLLRSMARQSAADYAQRNIVRVEPKDGRAQLVDNAVNLLAVDGNAPESEARREGSSEAQNGEADPKAPRTTTVVMPDMTPGKARDFMLRVTASGDNEIVFSGAEAFVEEEGALEPPGDGETVVYFFTETSSDVLLVARKAVERIET